jgi:hypothetical protein
MCEYLKLKILYVKYLEFENLKFEMLIWMCEYWKLKIEISNFFMKCLKGILKFEN